MFNPTRDQVRDFFFDAWRKFNARQTLAELEKIAVEHIARHPEYHAILAAPERYQQREWLPEMGETNPFLHLSMHLSISEQLSIDQPPGIRAAFTLLQSRRADRHEALHDVLECLGEMLWRAQRSKLPPDGEAYIDCVRRKAG